MANILGNLFNGGAGGPGNPLGGLFGGGLLGGGGLLNGGSSEGLAGVFENFLEGGDFGGNLASMLSTAGVDLQEAVNGITGEN